MSTGGAIFQVGENEQIFGWWGMEGGGELGLPPIPPVGTILTTAIFLTS